jgi:hypothetical protein
MSSRPHTLGLAALISTLLALAAPAYAHPDLDEGRRQAAELEFEPALAAFERALGSGGLTREELIELLAERALLLHALHRHNDLVEDFVWLSALDPDHRLDLRAPPDLTAIWTSVRDQGRGALKVSLAAHATEGGELDAKASLSGTLPQGVRARIVLRQPGGSWQTVDSSELREVLPESGLELYAEALGLGHVVVAHDHGPDSPLRISAGDLALAPAAAEPLEEAQSPGWARRHRNWLIGGAAAVVAIVVVAAVVATQTGGDETHSDSTTLKPMVSF